MFVHEARPTDPQLATVTVTSASDGIHSTHTHPGPPAGPQPLLRVLQFLSSAVKYSICEAHLKIQLPLTCLKGHMAIESIIIRLSTYKIYIYTHKLMIIYIYTYICTYIYIHTLYMHISKKWLNALRMLIRSIILSQRERNNCKLKCMLVFLWRIMTYIKIIRHMLLDSTRNFPLKYNWTCITWNDVIQGYLL